MCSCEPGWICRQCAGTPFDPYYFLDEPDELTPAEFDKLAGVREPDGSWQTWG